MSDDKNGSDIDIEKRRDDALRRALSTPPKPKEKGRAFAPQPPASKEDLENGSDAE